MQKKLLAVAVAGALGAPALALAQASTVQIYGRVNIEYTYVDQGSSAAAGFPELSNTDFLQTPGNAIGFKGEEKLGGGLSAWFQCESTADPRGTTVNGWCSRNSALGLKGGWGNLFIGTWDTPFKRTQGPLIVGSNQTGIWGASFLLDGASASTAVGAARTTFLRRQRDAINYDSPNFGGFQVMAAFTSAQTSTGTLDAASNNKPRVYSIAAQYRAGPLFVAAAYERHDEFNGAGRNGDDDGWHVGATYTWGPVRFGGLYTEQEFDTGTTAAPTNVEYRAWHVGVDWRIAGPHGLRAAYTRALDAKGSAGVVLAGRPTIPVGAPNDTGAELWQIRYVYTFSKRTEFNFGYAHLNNDGAPATGAAYTLGGLGAATAGGNNQDGWGVSLTHRW